LAAALKHKPQHRRASTAKNGLPAAPVLGFGVVATPLAASSWPPAPCADRHAAAGRRFPAIHRIAFQP